MFKPLHKDNKGFTIIEVLIVLAIAGLIMLIVFLAVPALQRNQRNNARNNDASRIAAAITECLANRNADKTACNNPADAGFQVGTLSQLSIPAADWGDSATTALGTGTITTVAISFQRTCNAAGDDDAQGGLREFAITFQLENGINRCLAS